MCIFTLLRHLLCTPGDVLGLLHALTHLIFAITLKFLKGININININVRTRKHQAVKWLAQAHATGKWQSKNRDGFIGTKIERIKVIVWALKFVLKRSRKRHLFIYLFISASIHKYNDKRLLCICGWAFSGRRLFSKETKIIDKWQLSVQGGKNLVSREHEHETTLGGRRAFLEGGAGAWAKVWKRVSHTVPATWCQVRSVAGYPPWAPHLDSFRGEGG